MAPPSRAVHGEAGEGHPIVRIPDRGPQGRGTCAALSGKRDPRNDAHRREARRDQPRPRLPRLRPAAGHRRRRAGSAEGPAPPVRDYLGREAAARRDRREGEAVQRDRRGSGGEHRRHVRLHGGDDDGDAERREPRRRGRHPRAILRELRPRRDCERGEGDVRPDGVALVVPRRGGAQAGVHEAPEGDRPEHAEQPDRRSVFAIRVADDRGPLRGHGHGRDHGRDLRAHHLRWAEAHLDCVRRRDGGPDRYAQRTLEDIQRDGMAGRLGDCDEADRGRDEARARLPHRRGATPPPDRGRRRARVPGLVLPRARRDVRAKARSPLDRAPGHRVRCLAARWRVLRHGGSHTVRLQGRLGVHEPPCRRARRRRRAGDVILLRPCGRTAVRALHVLEEGRNAPGGGTTPPGTPGVGMRDADLVLVDGDIHTMDSKKPRAKAIAFGGSRVLAVGSNAQAERWTGRGTKIVALRGRVVVPGFIDAHAHLMESASRLSNLRLHRCHSSEEVLDVLREGVARAKPGGWVVGDDWDETRWPEPRYLTRDDLDRVSVTVPVAAIRVDLHMASVNSAALGILSIPPHTRGFEIDPSGHPTGVLKEEALARIWDFIWPSPDRFAKSFLRVARAALALGITTVHDIVNETELRAYQIAKAVGHLPLRVYVMAREPLLPYFAAAGLARRFGDEWLRLGAIKVFSDGSLGARTAALLEPYADEPRETGHLI